MEGHTAADQEAEDQHTDGRPKADHRPLPLPPDGETTRDSAPRLGWGSGPAGPTRGRPIAGREDEERVVWAPRPTPWARGVSCCPQSPAARGSRSVCGSHVTDPTALRTPAPAPSSVPVPKRHP